MCPALFCLVYGFSNAATHNWHTPSTYGFLAAGVVLFVAFALWQGRAANPLLPRVVLDRNRGGAYLVDAHRLVRHVRHFPVPDLLPAADAGVLAGRHGLGVPADRGAIATSANLSAIVLMPRVGPKPLITVGMLVAAGAMTWLTRLGPHTGYVDGVLGPLILTGFGLGMVIAPSINTGMFGVAPRDAGVASATVTVGQQLGASIGTSLLNTIFAGAVTSYLTAHAASARFLGRQALTGLALTHGYDTAFWWIAGIFAGGAVVGGILLRPGPLYPKDAASRAAAAVRQTEAEAGPPP